MFKGSLRRNRSGSAFMSGTISDESTVDQSNVAAIMTHLEDRTTKILFVSVGTVRSRILATLVGCGEQIASAVT